MVVVIGINGFGRVGSQVLRASLSDPNVTVAAINDPFLTADAIAHAIKYDSTAGRFTGAVEVHAGTIVIDNQVIAISSRSDPSQIPWADFRVDVVVEASGVYTTTERAAAHLAGGASKVVITAPSADAPTIIVGANDEALKPSMQVISTGSCTAVALAPALRFLSDAYGLVDCSFTVIHAATSGQRVVDGASKDWRSGRAALTNIIPSVTGAVKSINKALPGTTNRIIGSSFRVPVQIGCAIDATVRLERPVAKATLDATFQTIPPESRYAKVLSFTADELVSSDVAGCAATILDSRASSALNDNVHKLLLWYDNEAGFAARVLELVKAASAAV